ncbi:hypothetical protein BDR06DRAFT_559072 [Suillus hirtellus]|nr:hypothetical protein BDR06DRAFT_559072 [Suillus hirtellus]
MRRILIYLSMLLIRVRADLAMSQTHSTSMFHLHKCTRNICNQCSEHVPDNWSPGARRVTLSGVSLPPTAV